MSRKRALPGKPAWRRMDRGATHRAGRGNPVVPETGQRARRRVPNKAGGPDVGRHAAAAAGDGKGIRVDGHCRTKVRGPDTLVAGAGSPIRTQRTTSRSRSQSRPRGAAAAAIRRDPRIPRACFRDVWRGIARHVGKHGGHRGRPGHGHGGAATSPCPAVRYARPPPWRVYRRGKDMPVARPGARCYD